MYKFSKVSQARLAQCHSDIKVIFTAVLQYSNISIVCGHRTREEQNKAFKQGLSKLKFPQSKHNCNPSMAIDVAPYSEQINGIDWQDAESFARIAGVVDVVTKQLLDKGLISHRIRWGGDWDMDNRTIDECFRDLPHFELIPA